MTDLERDKVERQAILNAIPVLELQIESLRQRAQALDLAIAKAEAPPVKWAPTGASGFKAPAVKSTCRTCATRTTRTIVSNGLTVAECQRCADSAKSPWATMVSETLGS